MNSLRGRSAVDRLAHNQEAQGATPCPATLPPISRIARIVADNPKLKPIALGLLRAHGQLGGEEAAREIAWLAEHVR